MSNYIAALPMYDWPERTAEVDAEWAVLRDLMRDEGIPAPEKLVRRNADVLSMPDGIRDGGGIEIAPDPSVLPADQLDLHVLWRHPALLIGQTCWGPMELGLARHVEVVGQADYSAFEGGQGPLYSSAIVMRADAPGVQTVAANGTADLPVTSMRGRRLAFNSSDSLSGVLALERDLQHIGQSLDIFSDRILTGGHRNSIKAVANGEADVAAIDCRSWALARRFEPAAEALIVVGWTALRPGLPFVVSRHLPGKMIQSIRRIVARNAGT